MIKFLFLFVLSATIAVAQSTDAPAKTELTKIYTQAITDFVKAANKKNNSAFDTLFFGKGYAGQPGLFPDIQLPEVIEGTHIKLVTPAVADKNQKQKKSRVYVNLPGWVNNEKAEFIFVVFSNGFEHQYDYYIDYKYNNTKKEFELEKVQFKGPPFEK